MSFEIKQKQLSKLGKATEISEIHQDKMIFINVPINSTCTLKVDLEVFMKNLNEYPSLKNLSKIVGIFIEKEIDRFSLFKSVIFTLSIDNYASYGFEMIDGTFYQ